MVKHTKSITLEERRKLGKFETPHRIAKFIVTWAIRKRDDVVLDPCTGLGILLFEAIQQLKKLGDSSEALNNVYAVDIDKLAVKNLTKKLGPSQNIIHADFLKVKSPRDASVLNSNTMLPLVDVVVCNPPYTRHQQLNHNYKEEIAKIIEEESGKEISRQSSIYVHFLMHAARFLKERGRMAFVTPSSFLDVNYGVALKRFLVDNFRIVAIILFSEGKLVFPKTLTTACITLLENEESKDRVVKFLKVDSPLSSGELLEVTENPNLLKKNGWGTFNDVSQISLNPIEKWNQHFGTNTTRGKGLIALASVAKVKRGVATGANEFFTLSDDAVQKLRLEHSFLKPVLTKARDAVFYDFTHEDFEKLRKAGRKVWLISSDKPKDELEGTQFLKYIEQGEVRGFHLRHLTSSRRIWYSSERRETSPIIFTYMSRQRPRFIYNKAKILVLNNFHFVYPEKEAVKDATELKAFLAYLNSNRAYNLLRKVGRMYGGGLLKVEPKELEKLPIIDFRRLIRRDTQTLANLFEQLCASARKGDCREIRKEIDQIIDLLR